MPGQLKRNIELVNQSDFIVRDFRDGELGRGCKEAAEELIPYLRGTIGGGNLKSDAKSGALLLLLGDEQGNDGLVNALGASEWDVLVDAFHALKYLVKPQCAGIPEFRPSDPPVDWPRICEALVPHIQSTDLFEARVAADALQFARDPAVAEAMVRLLPDLQPQVLVRAVLALEGSTKEVKGLEALEALIENENFTREPNDFQETKEDSREDSKIDGESLLVDHSGHNERSLDPCDIAHALVPFIKSQNPDVRTRAASAMRSFLLQLRNAIVAMDPSQVTSTRGMRVYVNDVDNACMFGFVALTAESLRDDLDLLDAFLVPKILQIARPLAFSLRFEITREIPTLWRNELANDPCLRYELAGSYIEELARKGINPYLICEVLAETLPREPTQQDLTVVTQAFATLGELKEEQASRISDPNPMLAASIHWLRLRIGTQEALKKIRASGIALHLSRDQEKTLTESQWPSIGPLFWSYAVFSAAEILLYIDLESDTFEAFGDLHLVAQHAPLIDGLSSISGGYVEEGSCRMLRPISDRVPVSFRMGERDVTCKVKAMGDWMDLEPILVAANAVLKADAKEERFFTITPDGQCAAIIFAPDKVFPHLCTELGIAVESYQSERL